MSISRILILAALPVLALAQGCKKAETQAPAVPAVSATVEARPAAAAPAASAPKTSPGAVKAPKPYEKKETWFELPNAAGGKIDLADYAGRPVMLMFFTETCPYCKKAAPFMERMNKAYKTGGLGVLGVSLNTDPVYAAAFAKQFGLTFPLTYEGGPIARRYNAQGVPFIFLLTKDHEVYNVWAGYHESFDEDIKSGIADVLK